MTRRTGWVTLIAVFSACFSLSSTSFAVGPRWSYEEAYDNVAAGEWYRDSNNETATLAWGESYVMMSLAAMYRATRDLRYLERLIHHADGVIAQRDDLRGVADYRGVAAACWQDRHYQPAEQPYCYVVHSGMIGYPIAELVRLIRDNDLADEVAADGETFGAKADGYLAALEEVVAAHDDQWRDTGYYVFRPDADFLDHAGRDLPLNQSNAMGRLLLVLADLTGRSDYLDKATALAERFRAQISASGGGYYWNYWGGAYAAPGEDISHASINADFAVEAAQTGVVFTAADLEAFATTYTSSIYLTDRSVFNNVGGGEHDGSSYRPQIGRWLRLTPTRTGIYTSVRNIYERDYPPESVTSGSLLLAWALLAEFEPPHCSHFFYSVDWFDPDPASTGDLRRATAYGANVLTTPPSLTAGCIVPLDAVVPRSTEVQQWDGDAYHTVARWAAESVEWRRYVPFDRRWPFIYWEDGVLFQFDDTFVEGEGIQVREVEALLPPTITSTPPTTAQVGTPLEYAATGEAAPPTWWSLRVAPTGARVDAATGVLSWTPNEAGSVSFNLWLENDAGADEQSFDVTVLDPEVDGDADGDSDGDGDGDADADADGDADGDIDGDADGDGDGDADGDGDSDEPARIEGGCQCRYGARACGLEGFTPLILGI